MIMSSNKYDKARILTEKVSNLLNFIPQGREIKTKEERDKDHLIANFTRRLMAKFKGINKAYRHFDRDYDNQISYKEFRVVCEEMDLRYTQ
jgi:hypothetical protein